MNQQTDNTPITPIADTPAVPPVPTLPTVPNIDLTEGSDRFEDVFYEYRPDEVVFCAQEEGNKWCYRSQNGMALRVEVLDDHTLRFRYAVQGTFEDDFSYSVAPMGEDAFSLYTTGGEAEHYFIQTRAIKCLISKRDLQVQLLDAADGQVICSDAAPFYARATILKGTTELRIEKKSGAGEAYFGLGDKSCAQNLRGQRLENWNTDAFGYDAERDPLYRSVPFYYGLHEGRAYGIFLHNTWRSHFDFAKTSPEAVAFSAEGGEMDYYFLYGPQLTEVASRYLFLTGAAELPPLWALGFHQCRWSYYPEARVRELAAEFRARQIPCDAIYLDIDYMDGYRCFTWDKGHFPQPAKMIGDLRSEGFHTVVMIDPGIRADPDYKVYSSGMEQGVFCRRTSGELMTGPVWPPVCVFPDFTRAAVRQWWGEWYRELYEREGVSGFWNDMNEPAVFKVNHMTFPDAVSHDYDGHPCDHRKAHNIYGQQMARASHEGLKAIQPHKRPFLLTRATFSGGQRYAAVWTGDNVASWEHLRLANIQCQRLSISGFSFVGTDIGGFVEQPTPELFVRWLQLGAFHPFYRVHSMGNNLDGAAEAEAELVKAAEATNRLDQEPWVFGEPYTEQAREAISFRYRLLPYLYTAFRQYVLRGRPVLRPLAFFDQQDAKAVQEEEAFLCGEHLLVQPILAAGVGSQRVYLPAGAWSHYGGGQVYEGRQEIQVDVVPDRLPVFVQAGAVVPEHPVRQHTGAPFHEPATLRLYPGGSQVSEWYEDAGEGYGYASGEYLLQTFTTTQAGQVFTVQRKAEGRRPLPFDTLYVAVPGWAGRAAAVSVDGKAVHATELDGALRFEVPAGFEEIVLRG